jgi:hypothetical protein
MLLVFPPHTAAGEVAATLCPALVFPKGRYKGTIYKPHGMSVLQVIESRLSVGLWIIHKANVYSELCTRHAVKASFRESELDWLKRHCMNNCDREKYQV